MTFAAADRIPAVLKSSETEIMAGEFRTETIISMDLKSAALTYLYLLIKVSEVYC